MEYTIDTKKLESIITKLVEKRFTNDDNYKIVKGVHHVVVTQREEGLVDYSIFLELKDDISQYLEGDRDNFLKEYNGYGFYGMEVERVLRIRNLNPEFRKVDVFQLFRDINDFIFGVLSGVDFHPTLCVTFFFMSR